MSEIMQKSLILLLCVLLISTMGCDKDNLELDYRDAYVGSYNSFKSCYDWDDGILGLDTLFYGITTLDVIAHPTEDSMLVVDDIVFPIDTSGRYFGWYEPPGYHFFVVSFFAIALFIVMWTGLWIVNASLGLGVYGILSIALGPQPSALGGDCCLWIGGASARAVPGEFFCSG
jgi:hypothetical protein